MLNINKIFLTGRLGADPEIKYFKNETAIAVLVLAVTNRLKKNSDTINNTNWYRIILYNKLINIAKNYLKKGVLLLIIGHIKTRKWIDKNNKDNYIIEIIAEQIQILNKYNNENKNTKEFIENKNYKKIYNKNLFNKNSEKLDEDYNNSDINDTDDELSDNIFEKSLSDKKIKKNYKKNYIKNLEKSNEDYNSDLNDTDDELSDNIFEKSLSDKEIKENYKKNYIKNLEKSNEDYNNSDLNDTDDELSDNIFEKSLSDEEIKEN